MDLVWLTAGRMSVLIAIGWAYHIEDVEKMNNMEAYLQENLPQEGTATKAKGKATLRVLVQPRRRADGARCQ